MSCKNKNYHSRNSCEKTKKSFFENYQKGCWKDEFVKECEKQGCLKNAIIAATNFDNRKMPDHQYRIGRKKMNEFGENLLQIKKEIKIVKKFDDLCNIISNRLYGIGKLTVYDTATRIGAYLNIYPEKIYLHAGTRIGAKNLLGKNNIKGKKYIEKEFLIENCHAKLKTLFHNLYPADIENFLCTEKDKFIKMQL